MNITLNDVSTEISLEDWSLFDSYLAHDWKRSGNEEFCKKYEENIEECRERLSYGKFCYLLGYLKYRDPSFKYDPSVKLHGYFLDACDQSFFEEGLYEEIEDELGLMYEDALPCLRERGFLLSEVDEADGVNQPPPRKTRKDEKWYKDKYYGDLEN